MQQWQHTGPISSHHDPASMSASSAAGVVWGVGAPPSAGATQPPMPPGSSQPSTEYPAGQRQFTPGSQRLHGGGLPPGPQAAGAPAATFSDGPTAAAKYGVYGRPPGTVYPQHK